MTSRERISRALAHEQTDRLPVDFGGCSVTGMHVSVVHQLRQALSLDPPGAPVKVIDPFQMLGEIAPDLADVLGIDTVALEGTGTFFGFRKTDWKSWTLFDGTPVLVPGNFNTEPNADGGICQYPCGDRSALPSGLMPAGGFYFDALARHPEPDYDHLLVEDNLEEFGPIPEDELALLEVESKRLAEDTDKALFGSFPGGGFGDMAWLPAPFLKEPKGLRDYDEWMVSLLMRQEFVHGIFERQCEIALQNLERLHGAIGNRISLIFLTGADYGTQRSPTIAPGLYKELFLPYYRLLNDWIHEHTTWKSFMHSCGAVEPLFPYFIEAGFDVVNPLQCSATGMDPVHLKATYGDRLTFWGGGVDTQHELPFGTPSEVREQVLRRCELFSTGGGFVFNAVHNLQPRTPVENVLAMFEAVREFNGEN